MSAAPVPSCSTPARLRSVWNCGTLSRAVPSPEPQEATAFARLSSKNAVSQKFRKSHLALGRGRGFIKDSNRPKWHFFNTC